MCRTTMTSGLDGSTLWPCGHAAVSSSTLKGSSAQRSATFDDSDYDLTNTEPLLLGVGAQNHFTGALDDVRIYGGALSDDQVSDLHRGGGTSA